MNKKALLVGINYPGTTSELRGCVNDVEAVKLVLQDVYDFDTICMLTDADATTENILNELEELVFMTYPGDELYFHYSGHGSQMYDNYDDDYEPDGLDEIICPVDLDWDTKVIRDDDLKRIFDKVPAGVNLTVTLDCCNSGGGLDHENQYQALGDARTEGDPGRFLPIPEDMVAPQFKLMEGKVKPRALQTPRDINSNCLLISGCQSHQTSADAFIDGKYMGAATYALLKVLSDYNYNISYLDLINEMNYFMKVRGYTQRPELNGNETSFIQPFMRKFNGTEFDPAFDIDPDATPIASPIPVEVPVEVPADNGSKSYNTIICLAVIAITAIVVMSL